MFRIPCSNSRARFSPQHAMRHNHNNQHTRKIFWMKHKLHDLRQCMKGTFSSSVWQQTTLSTPLHVPDCPQSPVHVLSKVVFSWDTLGAEKRDSQIFLCGRWWHPTRIAGNSASTRLIIAECPLQLQTSHSWTLAIHFPRQEIKILVSRYSANSKLWLQCAQEVCALDLYWPCKFSIGLIAFLAPRQTCLEPLLIRSGFRFIFIAHMSPKS